MTKKIKHIPLWRRYNTIHKDYARNKKELFIYFSLWNKWEIEWSDIDERMLFIASDYYYIRKMNEASI